ncbi:MAG: hypothetical protein Q8N10_02400 [Phenylobacterium sp.]|uniref:hypothetical protein n=1 Tax=Phenylobacterium sp. TaxID=1871053 RepID=UPI002718A162|nr:hypothetical protein [Phenylobacterium sp.]MDO8910890.1 hypothetical protein [Phenylobacterium sp.]MDP3099332.1 hypothetical protein [Phenylobacterium sp.]
MPRIAAAQTPEFREDVEAALTFALTVIATATAQGAAPGFRLSAAAGMTIGSYPGATRVSIHPNL